MIFAESRLKDLYRKLLWSLAPELTPYLPDAWEQRAVRMGGRIASRVLRKKREHILSNMRRAFPQREGLTSLSRQAFASHFSNQYLCFSFEKIQRSNSHAYLEIRGRERLTQALQAGKGAVLAHPHMGPAQLPLHVLGLEGIKMNQIGGGEITLVKLSHTGRWAAQSRAALEDGIAASLHDGKRWLRPALKALSHGEVLMSACDATGGGTEVGRRLPATLLGQPVALPVGHIWMALRSGAPLMSIHCYRNFGEGAPFVAEIGPEWIFDRSSDESAFRSGILQTEGFLNCVLQEHPGDWLFWDGFAPGGLISCIED